MVLSESGSAIVKNQVKGLGAWVVDCCVFCWFYLARNEEMQNSDLYCTSTASPQHWLQTEYPRQKEFS